MKYTVIMIPSATRTRVLVSHGTDELLRAILPSPSAVHHERAAITFIEGLSLWLDAKLHIVLSVDERGAGFCLGLTDELGLGMRSEYFDVEVHDRRARHRRGQRIRGIGDSPTCGSSTCGGAVPTGTDDGQAPQACRCVVRAGHTAPQVSPVPQRNRPGPIVCRERLGGLLRFYDREAV